MFKDFRIGTAVLVGCLLLSLLAANYGWFASTDSATASATAQASVRSGSRSGARSFFGGGGFLGGK